MKKNINKTLALFGAIGALTLTGCATTTCTQHANTKANSTQTMVYRDPIDRILDIPRYIFGITAKTVYTATNGAFSTLDAGIKGIEDAGFGGPYFGHGGYGQYRFKLVRVKTLEQNCNCKD